MGLIGYKFSISNDEKVLELIMAMVNVTAL
jgi:hypothetical protein